MSQRPKMWIHRTRRFWFGLITLILLTGFDLAMGYFACLVAYQEKPSSFRGLRGWSPEIVHVSGFLDGGFLYHRTVSSNYYYQYSYRTLARSSSASTGKWTYGLAEKMGFRLLPQTTYTDPFGNVCKDETYLFLPLWPLILLGAIIWPIWMHRADKKEVEIFATPTPDA